MDHLRNLSSDGVSARGNAIDVRIDLPLIDGDAVVVVVAVVVPTADEDVLVRVDVVPSDRIVSSGEDVVFDGM